MTTYTFRPSSSVQFVAWDNPAIWVGGVVPNGPDADVVIPTTTTLADSSPYVSFIGIDNGDRESVRSVQISNNFITVAGELAISGALTISAGGEIDMDGGVLNSASIDNSGTDIQGAGQIYASDVNNNSNIVGDGLSIQADNLSNGGSLTAASGPLTVTVTPGHFTNFSAGVLTGGQYQAGFDGTSTNGVHDILYLDIGGLVSTDAASFTLTNNSTIDSYDTASQQYMSLNSTLHDIAQAGSLTLSQGSYSFGSLLVSGTVVLSDTATLASTQLTIAPDGIINAFGGTVGTPVDNEGTIEAGSSAGNPGTLVLDGAVSGGGTLEIASGTIGDGKESLNSKSVLEINAAVSASQTLRFDNGVGQLILDQPQALAGTIAPTGTGDEIIVKGVSIGMITGVSYAAGASGGTLVLQQASGSTSLRFSGAFSVSSFSLAAGPQNLSSDPPSVLITVTGAAAQPPSSTATVSSEIELLYLSTLGRAADPVGLASYVAQTEQHSIGLANEAAAMIASPEALAHYGAQTDSQFVAQLFANSYGPAAANANSLSEMAQLVDKLGHGDITKGEVAVGVALGQEHLQAAGVNLPDGLIDPSLTGTFTTDPKSPGATAELVSLTLLGAPLSGLDLETGAQMLSQGASAADFAARLVLSAPPLILQESDTQFIDQLYANSFGRAPDAGGLAHYQAELGGGTARASVAADIALSPEHQSAAAESLSQGLYVPNPTGSALARLYEAILGRAPDLLFGLESDGHLLQQGLTLAARAASMLGSSEYAGHFGTPNDTTFVTDLYQNALGRAPESGGLSTYMAALAGGATRAAVALDIAESPEATRHLAPRIENGFVAT